MTDNTYPEIDGLKIIHREPGWEAEWAKAQHFLFDKKSALFEMYCAKALKKYAWLWEGCGHRKKDIFEDALSEFKSYVFLYWLELYASKTCDKHGVVQPVQSDFDPNLARKTKLPPFIQYLLSSIEACYLADKFVEETTSIANNFALKRKKAIAANGRLKGKTKDDIQKDIQQSSLTVSSISDKNYFGYKNEDADNNGSDVLESQQDIQNQRFQTIKSIIKLFIDYLNNECKGLAEDHFLSEVNRQAGAQLYPEMTESSLLDRSEAWIYSDQKHPVCNQEGIQWLLHKTLKEIEHNIPEQKPEQTLYDIHQKAAQKTECMRDLESEAAANSITRNPAFNRQFAPITDFDDLKRLFGITTEENARAERSRYTRSVVKWLKQNREMLEAVFDSVK